MVMVKVDPKVVGIVSAAGVLLLIGFMGGALLSKPDESAHQRAQAEYRQTLDAKNEEMKRREQTYREEIEKLNALHDEAISRLRSEITNKDIVVTRQGEVIGSRDKMLFVSWTSVFVILGVALFGCLFGVYLGVRYRDEAESVNRHKGTDVIEGVCE